MQKSKMATIFILIILLVYFLFSQFYLKTLGNIYIYLINPMFFAIVALILKFIMPVPYSIKKFKKTFLQYVVITVLLYTFIYLISGMFLTYGKNPYSITFIGILLNLYSVGFIIFLREYIRYKLINNVQKKDKTWMFALIIIVFTFQEIQINLLQDNFNVYYLFKFIFMTVIPVIIKNVLFTYIQTYTDYFSTFIYDLIMNIFIWISPVLPNAPWIYTAILDTVFPLMLLFFCKYEISTKDREHIYSVLKSKNPRALIPLVVGIILIIFFSIGLFPIKPIGIASGSMEPVLYVGDMVIVQKCGAADIKMGDIIEYKRKDFSVIHRVVDKFEKNGKLYFKTKGDNNSLQDDDDVEENQLQGKVIFKIPYIAYPSVWISRLTKAKTNVDVQLGN